MRLPRYTTIGVYYNYGDTNLNLDLQYINNNKNYDISVNYTNIYGGIGINKARDPLYGSINNDRRQCNDVPVMIDCINNDDEICKIKNSCISGKCPYYADGCSNNLERFFAYINIINGMMTKYNYDHKSDYQHITKVIIKGLPKKTGLCESLIAAKLFPYLIDIISPINGSLCTNNKCSVNDDGLYLCSNIGVLNDDDNIHNTNISYNTIDNLHNIKQCYDDKNGFDMSAALSNDICEHRAGCMEKCAANHDRAMNTAYYLYKNKPIELINYLKTDNTIRNIIKSGTMPIFGLQNRNDIACINGSSCGNYAGFGVWDWDKLEEFLGLFYNEFKVTTNSLAIPIYPREIALYDWIYVPDAWTK